MHVRERRLAREIGTLRGAGRRGIALLYPATYAVGMASLGFQAVYRLLNQLADTVAERAFLPEVGERPLRTYESGRPVADFPLCLASVAWELEIPGLIRCLEAAGIPARAAERGPEHSTVVVGGPLTMVNPRPLAPFADAVVVGEAELVLEPLVDRLFAGERVDELDGVWVPAVHGPDHVPAPERCPDDLLPARAVIWTAESALPDMFLVEAERGCSRACTFCVMRRAAGCGMRVVPSAAVLAAVPAGAPRVGLVGAAVSDHPELDRILRDLLERGSGLGLSSLRAVRVSAERVELLARGGYRTLTVAADGASERLREQLRKRVRAEHLAHTVELARARELEQVKIYVMVGVPGETGEDLDELCAAAADWAGRAGPTRVSLAVSPLVPKPGTPLARAPFAGVRELERRMRRLRRLEPRVRVRPASARWAWVEWVVAHGGPAVGEAVLEAHRRGGTFAAFKRTLSPFQPAPENGNLPG